MGIHDNEVSMLREAFPEYLELARMGISHRKPNGGALGYPSATCLFALIDAIGSYHRGDPSFTVQIEGRPETIRRTGHHIRILNSRYFEFDLTLEQLEALYELSRSPLTHNASLGGGQWLWVGEPARPAIESKADGIHVYLPALLAACEKAVERFLAVADEVVPRSLAVENLRRAAQRRSGQVREARANVEGLGGIATATGMGRS